MASGRDCIVLIGRGSLQPSPALSYEQTRLLLASGGCTFLPGQPNWPDPALHNDRRGAASLTVQMHLVTINHIELSGRGICGAVSGDLPARCKATPKTMTTTKASAALPNSPPTISVGLSDVRKQSIQNHIVPPYNR